MDAVIVIGVITGSVGAVYWMASAIGRRVVNALGNATQEEQRETLRGMLEC